MSCIFIFIFSFDNIILDPQANWQVAARVLGHLTTFTISFLLHPVARNSLWESAFGVPFERYDDVMMTVY